MFYLFCSFLLVACTTQIPLAEIDIKTAAERNMVNKRYKIAGEHYFALWCNYPSTNSDAMLFAAKAYCKSGDYNKAIELLNDFSIMSGDSNAEVYFVKALIYYNQVKSPLKNVDKAEKALVNLKEYKKFNITNMKEVIDMEEYLSDVINYSNLLDAYYALNSTPPGLVYAMQKADKELQSFPKGKYSKCVKKIYDSAKYNLGLK